MAHVEMGRHRDKRENQIGYQIDSGSVNSSGDQSFLSEGVLGYFYP